MLAQYPPTNSEDAVQIRHRLGRLNRLDTERATLKHLDREKTEVKRDLEPWQSAWTAVHSRMGRALGPSRCSSHFHKFDDGGQEVVERDDCVT